MIGDVRALVEIHLEFARSLTPPEDAHALDLEELLSEDLYFASAREPGRLLGIGALMHLDPTHAELKSIHTAAVARGRGVGRAIVEHLVTIADEHGYERVSLETGSMEEFAASRSLYQATGFEVCPPFADYLDSPNSVYMTRILDR